MQRYFKNRHSDDEKFVHTKFFECPPVLVPRVVELLFLKIPVGNLIAGQMQVQTVHRLRQATPDGGASREMCFEAGTRKDHHAASVFDNRPAKTMPMCELRQRVR